MKMSRRAKRMERHHKRTRQQASLNLVSLMDIFTILVFFLLVSSSTVQDLPSSKVVQLPESLAEQLPEETVVVLVNDTEILVQGRKIVDVAQVIDSKDQIIEPLRAELELLAGLKIAAVTPEGEPAPREVTIMGDREIPYKLLKKIIFTCSRADYANISLAVLRKTPVEPG